MMILDLNQVLISNLMMSIKMGCGCEVNEDHIRYMVLNSIRTNRMKFSNKFGELIIAADDMNYWRRDSFPYYKAARKKNRDKSPHDWKAIFTILSMIREEILEYLPYRLIRIDQAEADDVIATLVQFYGRELGGDPILILSADKDFQQLQKYSNVEQYDPTRKRWLKCNSPRRFLMEHIIRGDVGDGVPNIRSDDDVFIVSNKRQKPCAEVKVSAWLDELNSKDAKDVFDEALYRNWCRNKRLVDLTEIPDNIRAAVLKSYHEQANQSRSKLFNYFIKYQLRNLTECISDF